MQDKYHYLDGVEHINLPHGPGLVSIIFLPLTEYLPADHQAKYSTSSRHEPNPKHETQKKPYHRLSIKSPTPTPNPSHPKRLPIGPGAALPAPIPETQYPPRLVRCCAHVDLI